VKGTQQAKKARAQVIGDHRAARTAVRKAEEAAEAKVATNRARLDAIEARRAARYS
jgi:hypothetical protein